MEDTEVLKMPKRHLKKSVKIILGLIIFIILFIIIGLVLYSYMLSAISSKSNIVKYKIEDGAYVYNVGADLEKKGIIRSALAYKIYVKLHNINDYKKGTYVLDKSYSTQKIVSILKGDSYKQNGIKITFKEGITIRSVAKAISKNTNITESRFYSKMEDKDYINSLINQYWFLTEDINNKDIYYPLEGYLFPETYIFDEDVKVEDIIKRMLDETNKRFMPYKASFDSSKYSINEIVALASVIEKESVYEKDKKDISSVFYNRLSSNMSLGSDVTTYYAFKIELGKRDLTTKELNTYNAYNTRGPNMNGKLPVGAISNFDISSLDAALNPNKTDYLYFVADKNGKTHFTKTYEEHKKVIKELKDSGNWIEL